MKHLMLEGGIKVGTFKPPPPHFDPLSASPAELRKHGFPAMPDDPTLRAHYQRAFNQIKHKFAFIEPTFSVNHDKSHSSWLGGIRPDLGPLRSSAFSGGMVVAPPGQAFRWIEGDWILPNLNPPTQGKLYECAFLVGINNFMAGIHGMCKRYPSITTRLFYPFWQWGGGLEVAISNFAVRPGDVVSIVLCTPQGAGATEGTVFFANFTTGLGTSVALTAPGGLVSDEAFWIVEAPLDNGAISPLADYCEVIFSDCKAVTTTGGIMDGASGFSLFMTDAAGNVVSEGFLNPPNMVQCFYLGPS
jgi:hypothetical protein